jgi:polysaccharide export outer membrane protein
MRTDPVTTRTSVSRAHRAAAHAAAFAALLFSLLVSLPARADQPPTPAPQDYRIGSGDLLKITVFGSPDLATDARVAESGTITCPLIGTVQVAGLSTNAAEALLAKRYVDGGFLRSPQISVLVSEYQSQKVSVLGYVTKPGQYPLRASSKILDLLAEAGGVVPQTSSDQATLVRLSGVKATIDLDALFRGDPTQNLDVAGGDRIYVPKAEQFYVYGQVNRPGVYRLERDMTLSRAISASGGLTARGTERRAIVKRRDKDGKEAEYSVRGTDVLKPDDILFIKESLF